MHGQSRCLASRMFSQHSVQLCARILISTPGNIHASGAKYCQTVPHLHMQKACRPFTLLCYTAQFILAISARYAVLPAGISHCTCQAALTLLAPGMQKLVGGCPALASQPEFRRVMDLRSIDAIAVRLWFDRRLSTRFPANVLNGFEESAGGTFFNLTEMQASLDMRWRL